MKSKDPLANKSNTRTRHMYTSEQIQWMKDLVLPSYDDKDAIRKLANEFNTKFGAGLSAKAFYTKAASIKGTWENANSKKGKKNKKPSAAKLAKMPSNAYSTEQCDWLKAVTLPAYTNKAGLKTLSEDFKKIFGVEKTGMALYAKASYLRGTWTPQAGKSKKRTKHFYNDEQKTWLKNCKLPDYANKKGLRKLSRAFLDAFGVRLSIDAVYTMAGRLQGKLKNPRIGMVPEPKMSPGVSPLEGIEQLASGDHDVDVNSLQNVPGRRTHLTSAYDLYNGLEKLVFSLTGSDPAPVLENPDGKFKVIVNGKVIWAGDEKPNVKSFALCIVGVNGKVCHTSPTPAKHEIVQSV